MDFDDKPDGRHAILIGHEVKVCNVMTWTRWFKACKDHHVANESIGDVRISTVFLGLDHGIRGAPLWFETMVFGGNLDGLMQRYTTWEQAEAGHIAAAALVRADATVTREAVKDVLAKAFRGKDTP